MNDSRKTSTQFLLQLTVKTTMTSQGTQSATQDIEGGPKTVKKAQQQLSKAAQTSVYGDEVEKLNTVHDKYLQSQLALVDDLR